MGRGGAAFEPVLEQTVAERRALRGEYRKLHTEALAGKENLVRGGEELQAKLAQLNDLHKKVCRPREHAVDAEVFAQLTECSLNMIKRGQAANKGRTPSDLVRALRQKFINDPFLAATAVLPLAAFDWASLGAEASAIHRTAPGVSCMLGPLSAEVKVRRVGQRQAKRPAEQMVRPKELEHIHEEEKQETDRNMENMWRQLKRLGAGQQVLFTHLVCNHSSFAQTVENIFTLSFLVRDQRVRLIPDPERGLKVQPVSEAEKQQVQQQGVKAQQFMMSFTMEDWNVMKKLVPAAACIMPNRAAHATSPAASCAAAAAAESSRTAATRNKRARVSA